MIFMFYMLLKLCGAISDNELNNLFIKPLYLNDFI